MNATSSVRLCHIVHKPLTKQTRGFEGRSSFAVSAGIPKYAAYFQLLDVSVKRFFRPFIPIVLEGGENFPAIQINAIGDMPQQYGDA